MTPVKTYAYWLTQGWHARAMHANSDDAATGVKMREHSVMEPAAALAPEAYARYEAPW